MPCMSFYHPSMYKSRTNKHHLTLFSVSLEHQTYHHEQSIVPSRSLHHPPCSFSLCCIHHVLTAVACPQICSISAGWYPLFWSALLSAKTLSQPKWDYINPTLHPFPSLSLSPSEASLCSEAKNWNLLLSLQAFELPAPSIHEHHLHFALPDSFHVTFNFPSCCSVPRSCPFCHPGFSHTSPPAWNLPFVCG